MEKGILSNPFRAMVHRPSSGLSFGSSLYSSALPSFGESSPVRQHKHFTSKSEGDIGTKVRKSTTVNSLRANSKKLIQLKEELIEHSASEIAIISSNSVNRTESESDSDIDGSVDPSDKESVAVNQQTEDEPSTAELYNKTSSTTLIIDMLKLKK